VASWLEIPQSDLARIEALARAAFPEECCGLLVGRAGGRSAATRVTRIVESRNLATPSRRNRFEIDPEIQFKLLRELRAEPDDVIGVYHSHPDGRASPSPRDLEDAADESLIWLVTGLSQAAEDERIETRAFGLAPDRSRFEEIPIRGLNGD